MKCTVDGKWVTVTLSRANLVTLLAKLKREGSQCMLVRRCEGDVLLHVHAETDDQHYTERSRGRVEDLEEAAIVADRLS